MTEEEMKNCENIPCTLEEGMEYPEELYDLHNDCPLALERVMVDRVEKLIPNRNAKSRYVIHHRNLKQYINLGMKLTEILRIQFVR